MTRRQARLLIVATAAIGFPSGVVAAIVDPFWFDEFNRFASVVVNSFLLGWITVTTYAFYRRRRLRQRSDVL